MNSTFITGLLAMILLELDKAHFDFWWWKASIIALLIIGIIEYILRITTDNGI